jgi:type III secretory pathway component EscS
MVLSFQQLSSIKQQTSLFLIFFVDIFSVFMVLEIHLAEVYLVFTQFYYHSVRSIKTLKRMK